MSFPKELRYTKSHEWARQEGGKIMVGITDYAQNEISDVVFIELPKQGQLCEKEKPAAVVESVKAAFDIYAPVSGKIGKVNTELEANPAIVNSDCYGKGWFFEIEGASDADWNALMDSASYEAHLNQEAK